MLSQKNVYSDIMESDYECNGFYFTSYRKLLKFINDYERNRLFQNKKMHRYFLDICDFTFLYDLMLYLKVETKGFRVSYKGVEYTCLNNLRLELQNRIKSDYKS